MYDSLEQGLIFKDVIETKVTHESHMKVTCGNGKLKWHK